MNGAVAIRCETVSHIRQAFDARRRELGMTMVDLDAKSGVQDGYAAKVIAGIRRPGDMSLGAIAGALGLELHVIESRRPTLGAPRDLWDNLKDRLDALGLDLIVTRKPRQLALPPPSSRFYKERVRDTEGVR